MPTDKELPLDLVKRIDTSSLKKILDDMRVFLKADSNMQDVFDEYDVDIEEIDFIPMKFEDIDVSAKTSKCVISFSYALLQDADFFNDYSYGIHEITHWIQQSTGTKPTKSSDDENYLENENETEGFQHQIKFIDKHQGEEAAEQYVDELLEYHDKEGDENLKKELMEKI